MPNWVMALFQPIADIINKRQERKLAAETAKAKLKQSQADSEYKVEFTDQEWEALAIQQTQNSWRDEYATVSVLSVFNIVVLGGLLAAFGHPEVLTGIGIAMKALTDSGVDVGFLMEAVVLSAVGLSIWRKV